MTRFVRLPPSAIPWVTYLWASDVADSACEFRIRVVNGLGVIEHQVFPIGLIFEDS